MIIEISSNTLYFMCSHYKVANVKYCSERDSESIRESADHVHHLGAVQVHGGGAGFGK